MKLKKPSHRIPRPVRAVLCAVCVVMLAIAYYIALGCPTLTFRQEFRRAEKVHLVGPSKIVDTLGDEYYEFDKMLVGETEYGICFFGRYYNQRPYDNPFAEKQYRFHYVRKTGDITIAAAPNVFGIQWEHLDLEESLPVYLFTEDSDAVRAEVEITVEETPKDDSEDVSPSEYCFRAEAARSDSSFFLFWLTANDAPGLKALYALSNTTGNILHGPYISRNYNICATVRLYDANGKLICTESVDLVDRGIAYG